MDFICQQKEFFENPNKLPLNELRLDLRLCRKVGMVSKDKDLERSRTSLAKVYNIKSEKVPALDPRWIQRERTYNKYQPYCFEVSKTENDLFLSRNKTFLGDLKFLLRQTYHQFWNYLVFEPRVNTILDSFLLNAVPWYEAKHLDDACSNLYTQIYESVAQIYLRLLNAEESNIEFMSERVIQKYLEESNLVTYPKILCLCLLYNKTCQYLIEKFVSIYFCDLRSSVFTSEVETILSHTLLMFETVAGQVCGLEPNSGAEISIRKRPEKFDPYWVEEVVTYLLDAAATLCAFISNCKPAALMGFHMGIPYKLSYFYNKVYPALYEMLQDRANLPYNWNELKERIHDHIGLGRCEFVNVFHIFTSDLIDNVIQTVGNNGEQDDHVENYLELITSSLEYEFFIFDYHSTHHVDVQILTISDFYPNLDRARSDYILECLCTLPILQKVSSLQQISEEISQNKVLPIATSSKYYNGFENDAVIDMNAKPTPAEVEKRVQLVMDALPHLGDGFILKCLEAFNYSTTKVISSILDENLPSHIKEYPRDLIRIPPEPEPEQPILAYRGKKPTYRDASDLLDDKSEMQSIKEFISKISTQDMYDDDYDDRDVDGSARPFYDRNDEVSVYKHMGNRFEDYELVSDPSEGSSEEEEQVSPAIASRAKGPFCEDPAKVRARYEARHKLNTKGKSSDVVGKPKGQGQDANVTHNRSKKTVLKSSKANHNRKGGAQWKRSRGMVPM